METYTQEIVENKEDELYQSVIKRYDEIRIKIGKKPEDKTYIEKIDIQNSYKAIYNANTEWTFKKEILNKEKPLQVIRWQAKWRVGLPKNLQRYPFCTEPQMRWNHFLECEQVSEEIRKKKEEAVKIQRKLDPKTNVYGLMMDISLKDF